MELLSRLGRVIRANISHWLQTAEDPERVLDQAVADMQAELIQVRQAVAQAIATQKRTERQCDQYRTLAQEWHNRAQLALQKADEATAREALTQRQAYLRMISTLESHLTQQQGIVSTLRENMRTLENRITEARTRRDMYIARARSAAASQRIQTLMEQVGGRGTSAFERMEEKVLELETQSAAIADLNDTLAANTVEGRFAALENSSAAIDAELAALKAQLPQSQLPQSEPLQDS